MTRWEREFEEWQGIKNELIVTSHSGMVSAYDVSEEQRKRMALRGEQPMTLEEIQAELATLPVSDEPDGYCPCGESYEVPHSHGEL